MKTTVPARLRKTVELAVKHGYTVDNTSRGHIRLTPPVGRPVSFSSTPSDVASDRNSISLLRRQGVPVPHKGKVKP
jgi:hypothetical protein